MRSTHDQTNQQIQLAVNNNPNNNPNNNWNDGKKAKYCTCCVYFLLAIVGFSTFTHQYIIYADEELNSITRSEIKKIPDIIFPYLYIDTIFMDRVDLIGVWETGNNGNATYTDKSNIMHYDINNFIYNQSITKWSVVSDSNNRFKIMIVPPYNKKLKMGHSIGFEILSHSKPYVVPSNYKYEALIQHFTNGLDYGLFWIADNVDKLSNPIYPKQIFYGNDSDSKYEYTFTSTINFIQMDAFRRINKINPSKNAEYYEITQKASMLMEDYLNITDLYFYYNPIGGGVQTILTTDRLFGWEQILSNTGGIFSLFKDGALLFLGWMLFGFPLIGYGIAAKKGLNDDEKKRVRIYLEEIGLIDEEKVNAIKEKESSTKVFDILVEKKKRKKDRCWCCDIVCALCHFLA